MSLLRPILFCLLFFPLNPIYGQSYLFESESDVISYMDNKVFSNSNNGLEIEYGYISALNTYGISVKNKNDARFSFINVDITPYGTFADLYGMSIEDGSTFGFRLYRGKLVIGEGEPEPVTFYLK